MAIEDTDINIQQLFAANPDMKVLPLCVPYVVEKIALVGGGNAQ